jgi:hypothetical protein
MERPKIVFLPLFINIKNKQKQSNRIYIKRNIRQTVEKNLHRIPNNISKLQLLAHLCNFLIEK